MKANGHRSDIRERLLDDLRLVIKDADDLLRNTGQQVDEGYQMARARFESTLSSAKTGLSTLEQQVTEGARDALESSDRYVHEHPWQSVGIGALAGLLAGLWIGRR
jgi:ElaB/YqjD/DUF883 family membrane-anchored ribosome-binding protein